MTPLIVLLILVIIVALLFEYINGFHDSANAIATVVATKVLTPKTAVIYGAALNFVGAFSGTHVAKTISSGILTVDNTTQTVILCALLGAIIWNLITWYYGIPSSSSHALIGGLLGAGVIKYGLNVVNVEKITEKVIIPMISSPVLGLLIGFFFMLLLLWLFFKANPQIVNKHFRRLQLLSSGIMAFSHGSNDAQKTMGIITLALFSFGAIEAHDVPVWVIFICALMMGLGTMAGGWKIIRTMGNKVAKLKPIHGFAAETSAASIILTASHFGIPISTTHVISTSIMGVGSTLRFNAVKWGLVGNIVMAWVITIPACMMLSALIYLGISHISFIAGY
ncbi:MAG: inorganic phosphate transporter [Candidatus Melainabacteria bacterium GWF2_37_15]|nr:MAG: inorganic phosphate transporter [Candidatus Melainabacteria bacterium GWF2_37_15]